MKPKVFCYDDDFASLELPLTARLEEFIEKWNRLANRFRRDKITKYHHDGKRLHVWGEQIFNRVERCDKLGEFYYEKQELLDCFDHETRETDIEELVDRSRQEDRKIDEIADMIFAETDYSCRLDGVEVAFPVKIESETARRFTVSTMEYAINSDWVDPEKERLGFRRMEDHGIHLVVDYHKSFAKLSSLIAPKWLFFVQYRGWLLRVLEERDDKYLLCASGTEAGFLLPIQNLAARAAWVDKLECGRVCVPPLHPEYF
ncbi:MAG: hypothetical protein HZA20_14785 [Nitrospirae bacterium]|nr:hypothetical protein [Nitrospirota bacterium]